MELEDRGRIKRMTLPQDWKQEKKRDAKANTLTFCCPTDPELKLSFFYRGKPISDLSAENFRSLLKNRPHQLDRDELESIEVVIREASEPEYFDLKGVQTLELNGVMVLAVEGFWKLNDVDSLGIFVDVEGDGQTVDEIYYVAPVDRFQKFLPLIQRSLDSIEWN